MLSKLKENVTKCLPLLLGNRSGKYGKRLIRMMLSYMLGASKLAMAFDIKTAIIIGMIWVICPVISNTMTDTEMVWVTDPEKAAAPTVAYPPGIMSATLPPYLIPEKVHCLVQSKIILPSRGCRNVKSLLRD